MKVRSNIKVLCKHCYMARRGKIRFVYCKKNPKHKQRQGFHSEAGNGPCLCCSVGAELGAAVDGSLSVSTLGTTRLAVFPSAKGLAALGHGGSAISTPLRSGVREFSTRVRSLPTQTLASAASVKFAVRDTVDEQREIMQKKVREALLDERWKSPNNTVDVNPFVAAAAASGIRGDINCMVNMLAKTSFANSASVTVSSSRAAQRSKLETFTQQGFASIYGNVVLEKAR